MSIALLKRKSPRLKNYDYSSSRYYFITICTCKRQNLFGVVRQNKDNGTMILNHCGTIVDNHIQQIPQHYDGVNLHQYIVMPNHIHLLIELENDAPTPPITTIVGLLKSGISREAGFSVWQRSFHDHIIRNETDYKRIREYIENNPAKWAIDKYYNHTELCEREGQDPPLQ